MKLPVLCYVILVTLACSACRAHVASDGNPGVAAEKMVNKFPGINAEQMKSLLRAKEQYCIPSSLDSEEKIVLEKSTKGKCAIPLPTWLPEGFNVETININLGKELNPDSLQVCLTYSRKIPNGKKQVFTIEAGFEFGDIPYDGAQTINSSIGEIQLYYEPVEDGKKLKGYVMTDWFGCDSAAYPKYEYNNSAEFLVPKYTSTADSLEVISLEDTKKILASMEKL